MSGPGTVIVRVAERRVHLGDLLGRRRVRAASDRERRNVHSVGRRGRHGDVGQPAALKFDGVNDYVTFGPAAGASGLGATTFTLETWFKREGPGIATSTGSGGVTAVPLITKGMAQADGSNLDMNYFLGIDNVKRVIVADFEDAATGAEPPGDRRRCRSATTSGTTSR